MQQLRVGLIGAGSIAGAHVKGYVANPDVITLVAVADPVAENTQPRARADVYPSYADMLERRIRRGRHPADRVTDRLSDRVGSNFPTPARGDLQ
jgi:hypothetical protein